LSFSRRLNSTITCESCKDSSRKEEEEEEEEAGQPSLIIITGGSLKNSHCAMRMTRKVQVKTICSLR
jgi:hypothetical protein